MNDQTQEKPKTPMVVFNQQMESRLESIRNELPAHIPLERFRRTVLRAVQKNPDLLAADRASLINAALDAANDGLLPDGREGAMVVFKTKDKQKGYIQKVQWMPMVFGILKKIRNSGELKSITAQIVFDGDNFKYWIDNEGEHLLYEASDAPNKNIVRRVFAMAVTRDGGVYIEVMDMDDVEKVRSVSRARDRGPWVDWFEEMAKKTAIRRLSKRLPMSTDLDDLIRRDDALYDFDRASDRERQVETPRSIGGRLDALAGDQPAQIADNSDEEADPETGEIIDVEDVTGEDAGDGDEAGEEKEESAGGESPQEPADSPASDNPPQTQGTQSEGETQAEKPKADKEAATKPKDEKPADGSGEEDEDRFARAGRLGRQSADAGLRRGSFPAALKGDDMEEEQQVFLAAYDERIAEKGGKGK